MRHVPVLIASNNAHKLRELREIAAEYAPPALSVELLTPAGLGIDLDPEETADTYLGNAQIKARAFHARLAGAAGLFVLADDSGLEVAALGGRPGVHSARYHKRAPAGDGCLALLAELGGVPDARRSARFVAVMALIDPFGGERDVVGVCNGRIGHAKRGEGGFGFDPVFLVEDGGFDGSRTMSELSAREKNGISHRGRAMRQVLQALAADHTLR